MTAADWPEVAAIYRDGIATGHATFASAPADSFEEFCEGKLQPCALVAREGEGTGRIVGWATLSNVSDRCVYAGVAEVSIYVASPARGRGVGRRDLDAAGGSFPGEHRERHFARASRISRRGPSRSVGKNDLWSARGTLARCAVARASQHRRRQRLNSRCLADGLSVACAVRMKLDIPAGDFSGYIFDLDGTLIDTMPLHYRAGDAALRKAGL